MFTYFRVLIWIVKALGWCWPGLVVHFFEQGAWAARLLSVFFFFFWMKSGELLGKAELVREAQMQVRQRFSLLESGAEARLSVRALLRGGAEEIHEAHVRR